MFTFFIEVFDLKKPKYYSAENVKILVKKFFYKKINHNVFY